MNLTPYFASSTVFYISIKEIFDNLVGNWSFEREIYDKASQTLDKASGEASFVVSGEETNKLFYQE